MENIIIVAIAGFLCGLAGGFVLGMQNGIALCKLNHPQSCQKCGTSWTLTD